MQSCFFAPHPLLTSHERAFPPLAGCCKPLCLNSIDVLPGKSEKQPVKED